MPEEKLSGVFDKVEEIVITKVQEELSSLGISLNGTATVDFFVENNSVKTKIGLNAKLDIMRKGQLVSAMPLVGESTVELAKMPIRFTIPFKLSK